MGKRLEIFLFVNNVKCFLSGKLIRNIQKLSESARCTLDYSVNGGKSEFNEKLETEI